MVIFFFRRSPLRAQPLRSCSPKATLLSLSQDWKSNQDPTTSVCSDRLMFECVCVKWWDGAQRSAGKHVSWSSWEVGFQCVPTGLKGKSLSVLLQAPSSSLPATFLFHSFSIGALCLPFLSCCWYLYWWVLSPRTRAQNKTSGSEGNSWPESLKWIPVCSLPPVGSH